MTDKEFMKERLELVFTEQCVDFQDTQTTIHFPEITISNENTEERIIKDLFVRFFYEFNSYGSIVGFTRDLKGARTTFSAEDVYNGYRHSHLNATASSVRTNDDDDQYYLDSVDFTPFCMGEDTLDQVLGTLGMEFNRDQFSILLNTIDDFVRWESLNGGPYMVIEDLIKGTTAFYDITNTSYQDSVRDLVIEMFKKVSDEEWKMFKYLPDPKATVIPETEELIEHWETIAFKLLKWDRVPVIYKYERDYYKKNTGSQDIQERADNTEWEGHVIFKGTNFYPDITDNETIEELDSKIQQEGKIVPHPGMLSKVLRELENQLGNYLNKQDTWELQK